MKRPWIYLCVFGLLLVSAVLTAAPAERERNAWALFPPGTWITQRMAQTADGKTEIIDATKTLVQIAETDVRLRVVLERAENVMDEFTETLPLIPDYAAGKQTGMEDVLIDGAAHACEAWEYELPSSFGARQGKAWFSPVLMQVVKREESAAGETVSTVALRLETVRLLERDFDCVVLESKTAGKSGDQEVNSTSLTWVSRDMPGGIVKSETHAVIGESRIDQTSEVTAIGIAETE